MCIHGIEWFSDTPDFQDLLAADVDHQLYADNVVSTINPAILMDGNNTENAKPYTLSRSEVEDFKMDLI